MSEYVIETSKLTKVFGSKAAVDSLDIQVPSGSIVGFLGANGAGKTTTIRMIMGHLDPTGGQVRTLGMDPRSLDEQSKQRIAYVSENMNLPGWMTPQRAVKMSASIYPRWDASLAKTLLEEFNLQDVGPYSRLSKGQKRKICILLAICQNAELLVMDEPAFGLDVAARHDFLKHVLDVACLDGRTVFISSHLLSDLERIVDRIVVIDRGRLILQGDLEQLKAGLRQLHVPANVSRDELQQHFQVVRYKRPSPQETVVTVLDFEQERLHKLCAHHGWAQHARVFGLNLEDIFVELVKESCGQDRKEMEQ